jgi:hypothetical protein
LPVLIIICDPESREAFWIRFRAADAQITEAGWKLTIPYGNKLPSSKAALEALMPAVTDHLSTLKEYWRVNNMLFGFEFIIYAVDLKEVADMDVLGAHDFFDRLRSSKELAYHCQGKIEISFSGYDDDPRELFEIEEVKRYVTRLDGVLPDLFFFARSEEPFSTLLLFVFCLMGVGWEGERSTPSVTRKFMIDTTLLPPFLEWHFNGLNSISERLDLPESEIERISRAVGKMLGWPPGAEHAAP